MAIQGGPDIVEDGLVLHLDAAEPLCFRGEPTTNLASYTNGNASRGSWPYGVYTHSIETTGEFAGWEKIVATSVGSATSNYVMHMGQFFPTSGVQYTGSIEFYSPYNNLRFEITGGQGIWIATRIGSSNKYYRTIATSISTNMAWYLRTIASTPANTAITNGVIYYRRAQFEQKPYYTDFTIGTRGSTVATGGGLLDITNNGNNGTINRAASPSAAFYSGDNKGSLVFDGVDDYVNCGTPSISAGKITVNAWVKITTGGIFQHIVDSSSSSWHLAILNNNTPYFWNGSVYHLYSPILTVGQWYMLTGVQGTTLDIYINGVLGQSIASDVNVTTNTVNLGRFQGYGRQLNSNIAQVSIYNRALTASEIQQNYNATKGRFGL